MKKLAIYALAAFTAVAVSSCNKDGVEENIAPEPVGKYTLGTISAEFDPADTRTGLGTNSVVNWSNKDRIAIIKGSTIYQYELVSGAGMSIGQFEPVSTAATYNSIDELTAVYPAIAATVSGGTIKFNLNKNYDEATRKGFNILSWNNDSPYAFTYNDIKVSFKGTENPANASQVNFKFKQLATWCTFTFDLTKYADEKLEEITIGTTANTKGISGEATLNTTTNTVGAGSLKSVTWKFATSSAMSSIISRSVMLYPQITTSDQLKIVAKTNVRTLTFYASSTKAFTAGSTLRLPLDLTKFSLGTAGQEFAYTDEITSTVPTIYYYGTSNCLWTTGTSVAVDCRAFSTDRYFQRLGTVAASAPQAASAKVIWKENSLTGTISCSTPASGQFTVSGLAGSGNALVGIYDASNNLLWSFHIWKPEVDPTSGLLDYTVTQSGTYKVMPMALGATKIATASWTTPDGNGLYYQWGRKDPLGRGLSNGNGAANFVATTFTDSAASWVSYLDITTDATKTIANGGAGASGQDDAELDYKMIALSIKNPAKFIKGAEAWGSYDWVGKTNDYLWGNANGYNYPRPSQLKKKSIFDPCPSGYRVAPRDLWLNFSTTGANTNTTSDPTKATFNASNVADYAAHKGYSFYYAGTKTGATDFYPASGDRERSSGASAGVGSYGNYWSTSPAGSGSTGAGYLYFVATYVYPLLGGSRAYGFTVRCVQE